MSGLLNALLKINNNSEIGGKMKNTNLDKNPYSAYFISDDGETFLKTK